MDAPHWSDQYTAEELSTALTHHAAQLAHRYGLYDIANELRAAAECIDDLSDRCELAASKAEAMMVETAEIMRRTKAAMESLGKLP